MGIKNFVNLVTNGDEVVVVKDGADGILRVEDGAADGLPDVVDPLFAVGHEGGRTQLEVPPQRLLPQPADVVLP